MFKVLRRWTELGAAGEQVNMRWAQFGSIPEQLQYLRDMIDVYRATDLARGFALKVIREAGCADRNHACMALAIADWVQKNIRYMREFPERFQTPKATLRDRAGDCDDFTTLIGSALESIGIGVEVVGMKVNGKWKHVYPRALIERPPAAPLRMDLDATLRNTPVRELANPILRAAARGMKVETWVK